MQPSQRIPEELNLGFENSIIEIGEDDSTKKFYAIYDIGFGTTSLMRPISQQQYNEVERIWGNGNVALLIQSGNVWVVREEINNAEFLHL